jgi:tetratricopeptide (TPR) repeat protein
MSSPRRVSAWEEVVTIPTYPPPPPDPNPMFFERRVNQGASGHVYPNAFTDRVVHEAKVDQPYQAVFLENEYLHLMVLPQFGGRIHAAQDKTNGYDFIYRQHVIKPALIGLFGSWLSGGMEFNWPLHHRPSTFMPVEHALEQLDDGSVTLWLSEHEPMNRMKGMVGVCLRPGQALFELKVRLYNRTPLPQPFLWWINCAVHINDQYQLVFPPDVESVAFHSRAYMVSYPVASQLYAGLDWRSGVDISWLKNVTGVTSYFANPSQYDFFGGYDHDRQAGVIHVADRHTSPGKKLFTWGTSEFGAAWQATLTDADGPYAELMASSYSDNQPDFSWLQPYETKSFSHTWYPIQQIGVVKNANTRLAVSLGDNRVGVCATELLPGARVVVTAGETLLLDTATDLAPGKPFRAEVPLSLGAFPMLRVLDREGSELIRYQAEPPKSEPLPSVAVPPKPPAEIDSLEMLYLTGLHVEQYLHPTLDPAPYWERALDLDPGDARSNNALGRLLLRRGDFTRAEALFRRPLATLTQYNFNPYDSEPYYNLGLALAYQGRLAEAYEAFYKSIWSFAWQAAGYFALAQIDCRRGDWSRALDHLDRSLAAYSLNSKARDLKAAALRQAGQLTAAAETVRAALAADALDHWARCEEVLVLQALGQPTEAAAGALDRCLRGADQNYLDLAFDYANAGLYADAAALLHSALARGNRHPMVVYALGYFAAQMGRPGEASESYARAAALPPEGCFPARLEELIVLQAVRRANPQDGRAAYYLGNLLYDKKQYVPAIEAWETATRLEPELAVAWRNLGLACYNKRGDKPAARDCYEKAFALDPRDPRLLLETEQLLQRLGASPAARLALLEQHLDLVSQREDLLVGLAALFNQTGQPEKALELLLSHRFHPWEGGEGRTSRQYVLAHVLLGQAALESGRPRAGLDHFEAALVYPPNLGEGSGLGGLDPLAHYYAGLAAEQLGQADTAREHYRRVAAAEAEWSKWQPGSPLTYYTALALQKLGDEGGSRQKLQAMLDFATRQLTAEAAGGFDTSRPALTVFDDNAQEQNQIDSHLLMGLAQAGLGQVAESRQALQAVLALDPHHWEASQELRRMETKKP